jgi:hypothetical protein
MMVGQVPERDTAVTGTAHSGHVVAGSGSGGFTGQGDGRNDCEAVGDNGVISPMSVTSAGFALLFDIRYFAARCHFTVPANDAAASERGETEKPNETHNVLRRTAEQLLCRRSEL